MQRNSITLFIGSLSSGGAEHQIAQLANFLYEKGYSVSIVTYADIPDHYPVDNAIRRIRLGEGKNPLAKFLAIFLFFIRIKTDCIISYTQRANSFMLPALFFRRRIKVIVGERNFTFGKVTIHEKLLFGLLYKRADYIVPNSVSQSHYIIEHYPSYVNKVVVITNYTDINKYTSEGIPICNVIKIAVFGRYSPQKNCIKFAHAIYMLRKKSVIPFEIHWYGNKMVHNSISPYYIEFENTIKELGLSDIFFLHEHVLNVKEEMCKFELLCLPSLYEGFSNSLSEYICCGRPVLASNVSDNALMVRNGENGYLFKPQSVDDICGAFESYFSLTREERMSMGIRSRKIAESLFDKEKFIISYIRLIES